MKLYDTLQMDSIRTRSETASTASINVCGDRVPIKTVASVKVSFDKDQMKRIIDRMHELGQQWGPDAYGLFGEERSS